MKKTISRSTSCQACLLRSQQILLVDPQASLQIQTLAISLLKTRSRLPFWMRLKLAPSMLVPRRERPDSVSFLTSRRAAAHPTNMFSPIATIEIRLCRNMAAVQQAPFHSAPSILRRRSFPPSPQLCSHGSTRLAGLRPYGKECISYHSTRRSSSYSLKIPTSCITHRSTANVYCSNILFQALSSTSKSNHIDLSSSGAPSFYPRDTQRSRCGS